MKIVITGGAGFIGSYIVEYFASKSYVVSIDVIDKMTYAAHEENLKFISNPQKSHVNLWRPSIYTPSDDKRNKLQ